MKKILSFIISVTALAAAQTAAQPPEVPDRITFAGETVTFDRPDMYERMDRELITFTYMHTTSTLMLKRSAKVFHEVEPILKEYGIPDDFKYLMVIESNLDPTSVSRAGAAGLWQFMQAPARELGLEVNANVDERYHTAKATAAACKYLKNAYEKFGNWITAAASYNAGIGGIEARLSSQHQENALDLWLKSETSRYVFRILAAKMMFENPESFGFHISKEDMYKYTEPGKIIILTDEVPDLVEFAEKNNTSYAKLKAANLWLRESKLNNASHRTYGITIPR